MKHYIAGEQVDLEAERAELERIRALPPLEPEFHPIRRPREDDGLDHYDPADEWMQAEERREEDERIFGEKR